jgi:PAS domain S-box-containing protein
LKQLPEETRQILRLAACVGAEFDLDTLAIVCERSPQAISLDLLVAIQVGLIQPISELDENLLVQDYKFLHDRVQQAAYALIDESHKQVVHLQIGRNLLEKTSQEQRLERLFEIVDHLNRGIEQESDRTERTEIAKLNLIAGQKAKAAIAYSTAQNYLATGRELLPARSWQTNYQLTLDFYSETTEVAYLCGNFEQVEYWAAIVLQEAKTVLDTVKVYEAKIQTYMAQSQPLKAIDIALQILKQLGIGFPQKPSQSDIQRELDAIASLLSEKSIEDLSYLPQMTELDQLAAMQILSRITVAAWIAAPDLMPLLVSKQVNLSIQYGNALVSLFAYALYGTILCGIVGNIESGYQFGQLALKLLSQSNIHSLRARTLFVVNISIIHWKKSEREKLQPLLEGYHSGLETGDLEFAAYCAQGYSNQTYFIGKELVEVERNMATYSEAIRQIKQEVALNWIQIFQQTTANLMGRSLDPCRLVGKFYNEENGLSQHPANDGTAICCLYLSKLFLHYLLSEYVRAVEYAAIGESYLSYVAPTNIIVMHYLYNSLARLATYSESSDRVQSEILTKVASSQEKMKQWADYAPMNYLHKYYLVEAEKARVLGQLLEAEEFYEQAIQGAKDNEYLQEEALAYELAAKFYLSRGREKIAQTYMKEAHYCYDRWGAIAKVKDLENRYPQFFSHSSRLAPTSIPTTSETSSHRSDIALDLAAVMQASQAISREIELEQLLRSLMQILIQNAGAQTGYLILENSEEWLVEASYKLTDTKNVATQVLQSVPIANYLPESIINYVIRTQESVILNNAIGEGAFINDPYIQHNQTKSIFCLPLLNQAKLVGVLYLENQLTVGAFTLLRSQVLNLLSTQAAIAIENAKLYSQLRASQNELTQFFEAVPVGIVVVDTTGRPCYSNQQATQLAGKTFDPALTIKQLAKAHQLQLAGTDRPYPTEQIPIVRALSGERAKVDDIEIQRDDTTIPVEAWGTPVFDEQGNVAYAIATFQDITERKQAEKLLADYNRTLERQVAQRTAALQASEAALSDREQQLRLITDALPALISYIDINERYQFVNRGYEVWFNCSRDEILGKSIRELLGDKAYQVVQAYVEQVLAGQSVTYEVEMPYPFGKKYVSATFIPDFDRHNRVRGLYGLITDISERQAALRERKLAEDALRQSEANYRNLVKTANSIINRFDTQGRIRYINDYGLRFFGYEEHEILGRTLLETIVPETDICGRDLKQFIQDLFQNPGAYSQHENENLCKDGRRVWVAWSNQAILDENGNLVEILSVGHDITQRKQAEAALQRSEVKFRNIFENSQVGIFRARLSDGLILDANQRFANLFGFDSPEEVIGLLHGTDCYVNLSDRSSAIELLKRDGKLQNFEVQLRRRDGTSFWALYSARPNVADECMEGVIADISDRKQAEVALQASEAELRALFSAIPDSLCVITAEGRLIEKVEGNPKQVYRSIEEMVGKTLHQIFEKEQADKFLGYIQQVLRTQQVLTVEYSLWVDGQEIWLSARIAPIRHDRVIWLARDITLQKQAEAALQASEKELRTLIEAIPDPLYVLTAEGQILEAIAVEPDLQCRPAREMIGKTLHQLGKEQADEFVGYIQQALRTQQILTVEYSMFLNGRETWFSTRIAPIRHERVIWLTRDITARKRAEEASILEERNRMAREIHDTLAQAFTGILIQVGAATQVLTDDAEATQAHLDMIEELARTGLTEARRSVTALRPQLLEDGDLSSALDRLVAQMRAATDTALIYEIQGTAYPLPAEVENNLLRIGQEALTNAIKYAGASEIRIELVYDDARCSLRVQDNGRGFGVGGLPPIGGFGLLGMSERAERIGAQLSIKSEPGQGTEIVVIVNPLK